MQAAKEAILGAKCPGGPRVGLFAAVGGLRVGWSETLPAFEHQSPDGADAWERGLRLLHPFWLLQHLSNNAHALASARGRWPARTRRWSMKENCSGQRRSRSSDRIRFSIFIFFGLAAHQGLPASDPAIRHDRDVLW